MDHHPDIFNFFLFNSPAIINTQATTILVTLLIILIVISFFIAGAEVAYFSLNSKDINVLKTKQKAPYKRIVDLLDEPKTLLASLILASTLVNMGIIVISNFVIDELVNLDSWAKVLVKIVSITIVLVMFGEVMPKVMASQNNIRFAKDSGTLVAGIAYLFEGLGRRIVASSDFIERRLAKRANVTYNLDELDTAVDSRDNETTSEKEKNILRGIVKFGNITVKQIMRTRLDVSGIDHELSFADVIKRVEELHYSRLPVFRKDLDDVVGMIHTKDLLQYIDLPEYDWHSCIRPPYFIHEQKLIEDLLHEFQNKRIHFAIVVDEFGGTSGIVTLEDIMEEIIGDIRDEFDEEDITYNKIDDFNFIFEGKVMINDVCKALGIDLDTFDNVRGNSDSLAGLVLELAGEIPARDQVIPCGDFEFTVLEVERNRLQKIKVAIKPQQVA